MKYTFCILSFILLSRICASGQATSVLGGQAWKISNGNIILQDTLGDHSAQQYWNFLSRTLPVDILHKYVVSLRLFTDGKDEELGGMSPVNDYNSQWEIDIDTVDFNFHVHDSIHILGYVHTVIHEFGHLLTLNSEQIAFTKDEYQDDKKGYLTAEGYAGPESYLGQFVNQFWDLGLLTKWDKIDRIRTVNKKQNRLYRFYYRNENLFLTDYAAESPEEDIAESWTFFVLSEKPKRSMVKHEKVRFFYQFPKLVSFRNTIREQLYAIPKNYIDAYRIP